MIDVPVRLSWLQTAITAVVMATTISAPSYLSPAAADTALGTFYVRAGMAVDWSQEMRFKDQDCSSTSPAPEALYGCGPGGDGAPRSSLGNFGTMDGGTLGVSYAAVPALRLEAVMEYRPALSFQGHANFNQLPKERQEVSADLSILSVLLAGYLGLPELGLPRLGPFRPFLGAAVGLSHLDMEETHMKFPQTMTIVPGGQRTHPTWMLTAEFAVSLGRKMTLDLAWRYTDYGLAETDHATGRVIWHDASRDPLELNLAPTSSHLRSHGLMVSLRYAF